MKTLDTYKIVKKTFIQHFAKSSASSFMTLLFILAKVTSFLSTTACKRCVYISNLQDSQDILLILNTL